MLEHFISLCHICASYYVVKCRKKITDVRDTIGPCKTPFAYLLVQWRINQLQCSRACDTGKSFDYESQQVIPANVDTMAEWLRRLITIQIPVGAQVRFLCRECFLPLLALSLPEVSIIARSEAGSVREERIMVAQRISNHVWSPTVQPDCCATLL